MTLTVGDLRKHVTTGLVDPALQKLLDAAYVAIVKRAGATGAVTEFADGGYLTLILSRPVGSIASVTETIGDTPTVLSANDYRVSDYILTRLNTGTNPRSTWGVAEIVHTPPADGAEWDRVAIALVKLDLTHNPGLSAEKIGDWEETYVNNSAMHYGLEREAVLATLNAPTSMTVVGG